MNEAYSSAMRTRADGSRTRYRTSTGSPSTIETRSLLRFDSHQRGAARGRTAIPRRMTTNGTTRSEEHTSELQSRLHLVCRLLLEKKKKTNPIRASEARCRERRRDA